MSGWAARRFWKAATVEAVEGGFTVRLDGRAIKTPAKVLLVVPTRVMAEAIAVEWDAQDGLIRPDTMPVTRAANSAIDKVGAQRAEVIDLLAAYGATDLLCYRATGPAELVARQAMLWDPMLDWSAKALGAPLRAVAGVMHIEQDASSLGALRARIEALSDFEIVAFHDLVALSGSLVLALAVIDGRLDEGAAWELSRLDEIWQADLWGRDDEAEAAEAVRREAFGQAGRFYRLCR